MKKLNHFWSRIPVSYRGGIILAIPAICTVAILTTWIELRNEAISVHREIDRIESTIIEANNLLFLLINAETEVRGYAIAQHADFLQSYQRAIADIPNSLQKLEALKGNASQQQDLKEIDRLAQRELNLLARTIDRANNGTPAEVNTLLLTGDRTSTNLAEAIDDFKIKRRQILTTHRQNLFELRDITNISLWSAAIVSLLSFLAAVYLFSLLERELNDKQKILRSQAEEFANLNQTLTLTNSTLAERNQELDRFSHLVSHDLKAPLRGIKNISQWIEEDLEDKLTDDIQEHLHLQRERIIRMENMIDGLLQYARAGKENTAEETVDVRQLLETIIDSLNPPPKFTIAVEGKMPVITTQKLLLERVFSNLISNGIKHHPRLDGKITISACERKDFYEFTVTDNGAGISPSAQTNIFNIFHTLNSGNKQNTGVGLAIVKKIVEDRGGKITVESDLGKGATFRFQWIK